VLATRARAGSQAGARQDGFRVALAVEGGGMRGTISAGMALALDELGLVTAFDAVYGASAGAITAAWLLSRPQGLRGWTEPAYARAFIRRSGLLEAAFEAGRTATHAALAPLTFFHPSSPLLSAAQPAHRRVAHDREGFSTASRTRSFAIMKNPYQGRVPSASWEVSAVHRMPLGPSESSRVARWTLASAPWVTERNPL
jgi:hypothetical protein